MTKNGLQILLYLRRIVSHLKRKEEKKKVKIHRNSPKFTKKFSTSTKR